ncbi:MAG: hypothetical protein HPY59_06035 [Anaerolineae bacterium]|nr:hypothetical protein [Anaerolineae bacterium]
MSDSNLGPPEKYGDDLPEDSEERTPRPADKPEKPGERLKRLVENSQEFAERLGDPSQHPAGQTGPLGRRYEPAASQDDTDKLRISRQSATEGHDSPAGVSSAMGQRDRHPTGLPESTGGWYGQNPEPASESPFDSETKATPSSLPHQTIPVPSQSSNTRPEYPTLPPFPPISPGESQGPILPNRVDEVDRHATQVTPAAYGGGTTRSSNRGTTRYSRPATGTTRISGTLPPAARSRPSSPKKKAVRYEIDWGGTFGCLLKGIVGLIFVAVLALVFIVSVAVFRYFSIAATLPDISDLRARAAQFETTRILDRNGNLLYEILDPNAGRRTYVTLDKISPYLVAATIATEDKEFYNHPGFDPIAVTRALWQNYTSGDIVSGASTITQQLARTLLFSPEERSQRTYERKAREIVLAAEITRRYSKDEILELYLNEFNYGNLAYGVEAAAETYFKTTADKLTLAQAAFLAGLPQAPSVYDIYTNREETLRRHKQVLMLMYQLSLEEGCIEVSNSVQRVCVDGFAATEAAKEIEVYYFEKPQEFIRYPHWVHYIRSVLEERYDAQTIYRSGFTVYTTLDPGLQDEAQQIVYNQVSALADRNARNGALVAIRPATGEILAMVGSPDFYDDVNSGQVNMAVSPRQPGSSIKPLTYTAAFEKGWTPSTLIWDVPSEFPPSGDPSDPRPPYVPVNYDNRFHGPVLARVALANSYNVPAVKTLNFVGIYDNPNLPGEDGFLAFARRVGITTLTRDDYGLALTLGGGDVSLLELTGAYAIFANGGVRVPPVAITKIIDYQGNIIFEHQQAEGIQVVRPEHAFLISSILSDNAARAPMFGSNSVLNLPFQVAVKTGTTNDFRDNWTLGYTPDIAVGVWVGNADYTPMVNTTGLTGAAPIWSQFMRSAIDRLTGGNPSGFVRPPGVVDKIVCSISGTEPSEWCPSQQTEMFVYDQPPLPKKDDLWQKTQIDTWTGLKSSPYCSEYTKEEFALNVTDPWGVKWIRETNEGREWAKNIGFSDAIFFAPERECQASDPRVNILFAGLNENQTITTGPLDIYAVVTATQNFKDFRLEYGVGDNPVDWKTLIEGITSQYSQPERIYSWDLKDVPTGRVTLRIYVNSTQDTFAERQIHLNIQVPTPTPTITPTVTVTHTATSTPTLTSTSLPPTMTPTLIPTETPTP